MILKEKCLLFWKRNLQTFRMHYFVCYIVCLSSITRRFSEEDFEDFSIEQSPELPDVPEDFQCDVFPEILYGQALLNHHRSI
jgi:hypothetical protein